MILLKGFLVRPISLTKNTFNVIWMSRKIGPRFILSQKRLSKIWQTFSYLSDQNVGKMLSQVWYSITCYDNTINLLTMLVNQIEVQLRPLIKNRSRAVLLYEAAKKSRGGNWFGEYTSNVYRGLQGVCRFSLLYL